MRLHEGRGFLVRTGMDTPYTGWVSIRQLEESALIQSAPWMVVRRLCEVTRLLPGGLALLWDLPSQALTHLTPEARVAFWTVLGHMPGLTLHFKEESYAEFLGNPIPGWFHHPQPPAGAMGQVWRQGWIGWVPEAGDGWSLPGVGRPEDTLDPLEPCAPGWMWGEVILPLGALKEVTSADLAVLLGDLQAGLERNLSMRISAKAWPVSFPFQRRRTGWLLSVLGGREYTAANGDWLEAADRLRDLRDGLTDNLKCRVQLGSCHDPVAASLLGHQAMREGHPWRYSLPIPPASPSFTPGLNADPREVAPVEFRSAYPEALAPLFTHPPVAFLRVPNVPQESSVMAFLRGQRHWPAIQWLPPDLAPPGPFFHEKPWAAASSYQPLMDVTQALQPGLFEELDALTDAPG